jgi:hypothetical protein
VLAIVAGDCRRQTASTKRFFVFFTTPPLKRVSLGIQANGFQTSRFGVVTDINPPGLSSPHLKRRKSKLAIANFII